MTPGSDQSEAWHVRPVRDEDRVRWTELHRGYVDFYRTQQTDEERSRVWSWITDPEHEVSCLVVEDATSRIAGIAHYRTFARPLSASVGCFLDDLFVDPAFRGRGAVDALLSHLRELAERQGWSVVRWMTAEDNYRGRAKYDQHATRTPWVVYDMS